MRYDLSDFEARAYDPALGRFLRPDPMADKYHPLSPFLYCAANPLRLIDPDGLDYFYLDESCHLIERVVNDEIDRIIVRNDKGEEASIDFEYGSIDFSYACTPQEDANDTYSFFTTTNEDDSKKLFEFLSCNTKVEYINGQFISDDGYSNNIVMTSHLTNKVGCCDSYIKSQAILGKEFRITDVSFINHNHPSNILLPSGSDISFARDYNIYFNKKVRYGIYSALFNRYASYSEYSTEPSELDILFFEIIRNLYSLCKKWH